MWSGVWDQGNALCPPDRNGRDAQGREAREESLFSGAFMEPWRCGPLVALQARTASGMAGPGESVGFVHYTAVSEKSTKFLRCVVYHSHWHWHSKQIFGDCCSTGSAH